MSNEPLRKYKRPYPASTSTNRGDTGDSLEWRPGTNIQNTRRERHHPDPRNGLLGIRLRRA